ncbi:hypothetical protein E4U60_000224 [Claviceps pazoutovae]|uniref:Uncharacterized protein n=1 Tax=Claviceps pazoutovae TaxID=1649127 RepID=A0A9P7M101_9HYPO|nr:hypothetical protein E4U60_000224 [Claviceps pazoutovae]
MSLSTDCSLCDRVQSETPEQHRSHLSISPDLQSCGESSSNSMNDATASPSLPALPDSLGKVNQTMQGRQRRRGGGVVHTAGEKLVSSRE